MRLFKKTIERIKELRRLGLTYKAISLQIGITKSTALYWGNERYREKSRERARNRSRNLSKEERKERYKKRYNYFKNYLKNRYKDDPEFRARFIQYQIKSFNKRRKIWKEQNKCFTCGKEKKNKKLKTCEHCRMKRRLQAQRKKNEKKRDQSFY